MPRGHVAILHIIMAFVVLSIAWLAAEDKPARAADHAAPIGEARG